MHLYSPVGFRSHREVIELSLPQLFKMRKKNHPNLQSKLFRAKYLNFVFKSLVTLGEQGLSKHASSLLTWFEMIFTIPKATVFATRIVTPAVIDCNFIFHWAEKND